MQEGQQNLEILQNELLHIDPEKETKIQALIEDFIVNQAEEQKRKNGGGDYKGEYYDDLGILEIKISEHLAKELQGEETWICRIEKHSTILKWWEKAQPYHLNKQKLAESKRLLEEQAKDHEKMIIATKDLKIFLIRVKIDIDSKIKNLVQSYYERLSKFGEVGVCDGQNYLVFQRLSYYEISQIAQFLDHKDIERFLRLSKACHYGACEAIIKNVEAFERYFSEGSYKKNDEYLSQNLPHNIIDLANFKIQSGSLDFSKLSANLDKTPAIQETIHLIFKLIYPWNKRNKYEPKEFKRSFLDSQEKAISLCDDVSFTQIGTENYKYVVRRKKMWDIENQTLPQSVNLKPLFDYIDNAIAFLSIRENITLFKKMNEFYSVLLKTTYLTYYAHKKTLMTQKISHIKRFHGGRIDGLMPSKIKQLEIPGLSANVLSNIIPFLSLSHAFNKFRGISRKCNNSFVSYVTYYAFDIEKMLRQNYTQDQIEECKQDIKNSLTQVTKIQALGRELMEIRGQAKLIIEKKYYHILSILSFNMIKSEAETWFKCVNPESNDTGEPNFMSSKLFSDSLANIHLIQGPRFQSARYFIQRYGPNQGEEEDYLRTQRVKEDTKMEYIKLIMKYWFVDREKLKGRSLLHRLILEQEDSKYDINLMQKYFQKFKKNKYNEHMGLQSEENKEDLGKDKKKKK
eukprot:403369996